MDLVPTSDELALFDDISALAASLWEKSLAIVGLNIDPKMLSVMLYKRLCSNHRAYALLWTNALNLESDIILRSALETAICIAANFRLRDGFVSLMRGDAAFTVQSQARLHGDINGEIVAEGEAVARDLRAHLPAGTKPAKLNWKSLAEQGGVSDLYGFYRMLSGVSSHVTGLSILRSVTGADEKAELQKELHDLTRKTHLMMMAAATLQGSLLHAGMIDQGAQVEKAHSLIGQMNDLTLRWPGAGE
jgi:hypothetical protein